MFRNENLYFLLSCTNSIFGKILVPEIWAKMFSASQIAGFFIQPYLQNKSLKEPDFLHVDTNSHKSWLKNFWMAVVRNGFGWAVHRALKLTRSQEWIDRMKSFFACWCRLRKAKSCFTDFWICVVKNGCDQLVRERLKYFEWVFELSWFFACCLWCSGLL